MNTIIKAETLLITIQLVFFAAGCHPYSSRGYERNYPANMERKSLQDADQDLTQALSLTLSGARGFYYLTSGGNGLDVDTGTVTAASDGTILFVAIVEDPNGDLRHRVFLLDPGGKNPFATVTINGSNPPETETLYDDQYVDAVDSNGTVSFDPVQDLDSNDSLYYIISKLKDEADRQNIPEPHDI